ncbi:MAG: DUF4126 family protein [Janthinobacterium lividum]
MGFFLVLLLGMCTGLRTLTPIAVLCWFAYRNALHLVGWRSFTANIIAVIIFTLMALGEYVGDKLPNTPSRTAPIGLLGRSAFGAFVGLLLAQPLLLNPAAAILLGIVGALLGTYVGWFARTRSVAALKVPDWPIAVLEDCLTITFSILLLNAVVTRSALFLGNEGGLLR